MSNESSQTKSLQIPQSFLLEIDLFSQETFKELIADKFIQEKDFIIAKAFESNRSYLFNAELFNKNFYYEILSFGIIRNRNMANPLNNRNVISKVEYYVIKYSKYRKYRGSENFVAEFVGTDKDFKKSRSFRKFFRDNVERYNFPLLKPELQEIFYSRYNLRYEPTESDLIISKIVNIIGLIALYLSLPYVLSIFWRIFLKILVLDETEYPYLFLNGIVFKGILIKTVLYLGIRLSSSPAWMLVVLKFFFLIDFLYIFNLMLIAQRL